MSETGVVKFGSEHIAREITDFDQLDELNAVREKLRACGWMGVDVNGIGFGNISLRAGTTNMFYITASGTGGLARLGPDHIAKVTAVDVARNWLRCEGALASSESLTHAAVYAANAQARAVIHCHSAELWPRLMHVVPTTLLEVDYGTPELAVEVAQLFATTDLATEKIFVMGGHENGLISFGSNLAEAFAALDR